MRRLIQLTSNVLVLLLVPSLLVAGFLFCGTLLFSYAHGWSNLPQVVISGLAFAVTLMVLRILTRLPRSRRSEASLRVPPAAPPEVFLDPILEPPVPPKPRSSLLDQLRDDEANALAHGVFLERRKG